MPFNVAEKLAIFVAGFVLAPGAPGVGVGVGVAPCTSNEPLSMRPLPHEESRGHVDRDKGAE